MKRSRETKSVTLVLALALVIVLALATAAMAEPGKDNPNEPDEGCYKIEGPATGEYSLGDATVDIDVYQDEDSWYLDFESDTPVTQVIVKGGGVDGGQKVYDYDPAVTSDTGLHAPENQGQEGQEGEKWPEISYVIFCFGTTESSTVTSDISTETSTVTSDVSTVTEVQTGAGGSTGLGAGTWALGFLALALAGGLGWTALRPALKKK
jgi:hypothetical protein